MSFADLVTATNYSFLRGASHPKDMVGQALALGHSGIGIADRNTVAGVVRAHVALKESQAKSREETGSETPFKLAVGSRLVFVDGTPDIVVYPRTRYGWGRLTRLLTLGNRRAEKGGCILRFADLLEFAQDMVLIVLSESSFDPHEVDEAKHSRPKSDDSSNVVTLEFSDRHPGLVPGPTGEHATVSRLERWAPAQGRGDDRLERVLARLAKALPGGIWLGVSMPRAGRDGRKLARLCRLANEAHVPVLATCDALYATAGQRPLHDIVTCIRKGETVAGAGRLLEANGERHLKPETEMRRLFRDRPDAVDESERILSLIDFTLDQLKYEYPHEPVPPGWDPQDWLEHLVYKEANKQHPDGIPVKLQKTLDEEFELIRDRNYAYYFLTVYEAVKFAREQKPPILCQGRGSAANSAVCYLLGVTSVDPMKYDLLFSRFVSSKRDEPPDIDVDFEHERREDVIQHIYERYGRHRAAIAATVIHYRARSTVREVGKALGLSEDVTQRLTSTVWGSYASSMEEDRFAMAGYSLDNPAMAQLKTIVDQLLEFPRHLSQHVGGFVLTQDRLDETVPLHNAAMEDRTFIEWDKDDIDALGLMKVDILALGMLTCIQKCFDLMRLHGLGDYDLKSIPQDDPEVYDMLRKGDSIGVFQIESRAQINMLPRLKPRKFYDLVIQVAIVRPGPIEGDMVHPYLRRRAGKEKPELPSPKYGDPGELKDVLGKTEGVPLFQEQAMKLAIVAAGFSPDKANELRKAMATFRNAGTIGNLKADMIEGMVKRGYERDFAERCYKQIEGFGSYGFPESHALSFAGLVYVSSWIKYHHPAVFCAALLNSQPMGFYAPAQLVGDARKHGVEVREVDVNVSAWDNTIEPVLNRDPGLVPGVTHPQSTPSLVAQWTLEHVRGDEEGKGVALRLGFRQIDGFKEDWAKSLVASRETGPFASVEELAARANLPSRALRLLADADAFRSIDLDRRGALWEARRMPGDVLPLFAAAEARQLGAETDAQLPAMPLSEHVAADYQVTRLSLKGHPMQFLREGFEREGVLSSAEAGRLSKGRVRVAGVVLVRQRPGKGNAIFVTLEDETGIVNVLFWARTFEVYRRQIMAAHLMEVEGEVRKSEEGVLHIIGARAIDRTEELSKLSEDHVTRPPMARADVSLAPDHRRDVAPRGSHPRNVRILPKSRDFH